MNKKGTDNLKGWQGAIKSMTDSLKRAPNEPEPDYLDTLYALLVRRGYAQHEAHSLAFGDPLPAVPAPPPPDVQRDAERYRWLRDGWWLDPRADVTPDPMMSAETPEQFDAAIDAARAAEAKLGAP